MARPPNYKTPEQMQLKIDEYFDSCKRKPLLDDDGNVYTDKNGKAIFTDEKPMTMSGLALALGFTSRQTLLNYKAKKEFVDTVTRAKARVEAYAESRLFDKDGARGAMFSLERNFRGWGASNEENADVLRKLDDVLKGIDKKAE